MAKKRRTAQTFIEDSKEIHGIDTFSYEYTIFVNVHTKVKLFCKVHNKIFEVSPNKHLQGQGCQLCAYQKRSQDKCKDLNHFITKSVKKHGSLYDYANSVYTKATNHIIIKCNTCNNYFEQIAALHMNGSGCSKCEHDRGLDTQRHTTKTFIEVSKLVHLNDYSYEHTNYGKNNTDKVWVTCNKCNITVRVIPSNFLRGVKPSCNCPKHYGYQENKPAILYYLSINNGQAFKIGITNKTVQERFSKSDLEKISIIKTWKSIDGKIIRDLETEILRTFKIFKYTGPDLLENGNSELFNRDIFYFLVTQESTD